MLTTRDVLRSSEAIQRIWKLGLKDDSITVEVIESTNLAEIAQDVLDRQSQFVFKLTSVLLRGVTVLYYKKTNVLLQICQSVLERISLKFQSAPPDDESTEKSKDKPAMEVDEETLSIWRQGNLESIIAAERSEQPAIQTRSVFIETPDRRPQSASQISIDDDFGTIPFILSNTQFSDANEPNEADDNELPIPADLPDATDFVPLQSQLESRRSRHRLSIDESPLIPMTQLSAVLEDPSSLLCQRPICKVPKRRSTFQTPTAGHFSQLYDEARKRSTRYTPEDLPCIGEETIEFADDLPQLLFQADEVFEEQREEEPPIDILETIQWRLQECDSIGLMEVAPSNARRDLARTFFAAMCLHNRGAIRLAQEVPGGEIRIAIGEA